jgi:SAM-dependent methyltransferase
MTSSTSPKPPAKSHGGGEASAWVARFLPLVKPGGEVLDLACGAGRHTRLAAGLGYRVTALDRNREALDSLAGEAGIDRLEHDLEADGALWPFAPDRFDGIIVTNYLHRPLMPRLLESLADGGMLIYETFAAGNERHGKPSRPDFLLQPGELLETCRTLTIVAFEQGHQTKPADSVRQRICAVRGTAPADISLP